MVKLGELADRIDNIRVRTRAPGVDIEAELLNRSQVLFEFGESVYEFIDENALKRALEDLARLLCAGWQRKYLEAVNETDLGIEPNDRHDFNFREEVRSVEASGESSDGRVVLSTVGMQEFSAEIKRGTVRELREAEFVARIAEVAPLLIENFRGKVDELKVRYYG